MSSLKVLDIFAGAGGLSNGFEQTDKFKVKIAVEIDKSARETYSENHKNVKLKSDITKIEFFDTKGKIKPEYSDIDIVIGGPPCQGFSNANRQKNTLISSNNQLVKEYLRAIEAIKPKAFVMENVNSMDSDKHKFYLSKIDNVDELKRLQVRINTEKIKIGEANEYFKAIKQLFEQKENHLKDLSPFLIQKNTFSRLNTIYKYAKKTNKSDLQKYFSKNSNINYLNRLLNNWYGQYLACWDKKFENEWVKLRDGLKNYIDTKNNIDDILPSLTRIIETQKIMFKLQEVYQNNIIYNTLHEKEDAVVIELYTFNVFKYIVAKLKDSGYCLNERDYILNAAEYGVPQVRKRLILIGVRTDVLVKKEVEKPKPLFQDESNYYTIYEAIGDLEEEETEVDLKTCKKIRSTKPISENKLNHYLNNNSEILLNHVRTDTRETALKRFKALEQGQNFHNLDESLKTTYSDHTRTQNTIYKRLQYDRASDTVLNVRKSMWIHPTKHRALSIRESARLQSFQDTYLFKGTKDSQYQQIANAVPPLLARFVAEEILELLGERVDTSVREVVGKELNKQICL
jgi:DNA (cytosine-5)-methyltransferase 1